MEHGPKHPRCKTTSGLSEKSADSATSPCAHIADLIQHGEIIVLEIRPGGLERRCSLLALRDLGTFLRAGLCSAEGGPLRARRNLFLFVEDLSEPLFHLPKFRGIHQILTIRVY